VHSDCVSLSYRQLIGNSCSGKIDTFCKGGSCDKYCLIYQKEGSNEVRQGIK